MAHAAKACHFQGQAIVAESGHRPSDDGHADNLPVLDGGQRELVANDGPVVTVVFLDEGVGLGQ